MSSKMKRNLTPSDVSDEIYQIQQELKELDKRNTKLHYYITSRLDHLDKLVQECIELQTTLISQEQNCNTSCTSSKTLIYYFLISFLMSLVLTFISNLK